MKLPERPVYRFADIEFDPARNCLRRDGQEQMLRQKSLQVLLYLIEHRERSVSKEELLQNVWEGTAVTDDALVQIIVELRKLLGDDSRQPRFIRTIPKAGYHFIASVEEPPSTLSALPPGAFEVEEITSVQVEFAEEVQYPAQLAKQLVAQPADQLAALPPAAGLTQRNWRQRNLRWLAVLGIGLLALAVLAVFYGGKRRQSAAEVTLPRVPGKRAVAVMYFENQSGDDELDWLREGLADMLITDFSRSQKLSVLGRGQLHLLLERIGYDPESKLRLDDALNLARGIRAEVIALGSFARLDGKIRVDAQLYDARNGQLLTAERLVVEQPAQLLTQVDLLAAKLASHLSAPADQAVNTGLTSVMTNNLQAYRHYSLGVEKAQTLLYVEAVALFEKAVALDPEFAMAHARIGYTYAMCWTRPDESKPYLEKAFRLSGRLTEKDKLSITAWYAVANGDYPAAIETYRQLIAHYPLEVEAYWRLARLLRGESRMEESVEVAKQGLAVDAGAKDIYNMLGVTYTEMGRHDDAIASLHRYIELAPGDPNVYDSLGMAYQWAGRYPEAIAAFEKALALNPQFEIAFIHLGNTYVWQGRYQDAARQYQRFIQVASFDAYRTRGYGGIATLHVKKQEFAEAERAARAALKYDKQNLGPLFLLALERGDLATAERLMATAETIRALDRGNRGYERWRPYFRGYLALKSGRAAEAVEHFKAALKHRPLVFNIDAYEDCLANAYLELGRLDEAIAEYERILRLNPNYPLAQFHLGQAYERKGDAARARSAYERFRQIWQAADADIPEVIEAQRRLRTP
jgi:tetratricopeptide (TPR) repeat protein/DNA-binding winged helix-turn-helix (wHTH) protein